jgi:preprotein translocase subunit SecF
MEFNIDFLKARKIWGSLSLALVILGALLLVFVGLNPGIDFTGGTQLRIQFEKDVSTGQIRDTLAKISLPGLDLSKSTIQEFRDLKNVYTIIMKATGEEEVNLVISGLDNQLEGDMEVLSREVIGSQISQELAKKGWQAILIALLVILIYITLRFQFKYAIGAVAALVHDVTVALAVFAIFKIEINLPVIAAFLTIIGYSLNDTIVIFDRVRENASSKLMRKTSFYDIINKSINQSLSRTINTSLTTFIPVVILFIFGGSVLKAFSLALLIGVIVGTYSSIYVANPIAYLLTKMTSSE